MCQNNLVHLLNIYHFTYIFSHAHTEAHTHKHTCTISTQEEWRQLGTGVWLRGAKKMGLAHRKTMSGKPDIHEIKKKCFEHIELPAKLLVYFLRSNKSETSINHSSKATSLFLTKQLKKHQWNLPSYVNKNGTDCVQRLLNVMDADLVAIWMGFKIRGYGKYSQLWTFHQFE